MKLFLNLTLLSILVLFIAAGCSQPSSADTVNDTNDSHESSEDSDVVADLQSGPGWTPPDDRKPRFLFIHHSTGSGFMHSGGMAQKLTDAGFEVHSRTYGDGWVGDNTNPDHFPVVFTEHYDDMVTWDLPSGQQYDIIAFKSCYPASNICSDEKLEQYKEYYAIVKSVTSQHPEILFIPWSTPPLVPGATEPHCANRARQFANWLVDDYCVGETNMLAYNCFDVLAGSSPDSGDFNRLRFDYQKNDSDSHPNPTANAAVADDFTAWLSELVFGD